MAKKTKDTSTSLGFTAERPFWALVAPDGTTHPGWMYESKEELMREAPASLYGDTSTWSRAEKEGFSAKKFYLTREKPKAKGKPKAKKDAAPTDTEMLDFLQKNAREIKRGSVRSWNITGNKAGKINVGSTSHIGGITLRKTIERAIKANLK
jgi:hypothetical protein